MIVQGPLTDAQRHRSQFYYQMFNLFNGASYRCLGETVIILLAVQMACPNSLVSLLGATLYLSYFLLPLGKCVASRVGAVQCQSVFWIARNVSGLLVAATVPIYLQGHHKTALALLVFAAFLFYGCRAAGLVIARPLLGELTTSNERARFFSLSIQVFNFSSAITMVTVTILLRYWKGIWPLFWVILVGALFGFTGVGFLIHVDETIGLRDAARQKLIDGARWLIHNANARLQVISTMVFNICYIMITPISTLAIKRGYGVDDRSALLYAILMMIGSILITPISVPFTRAYGPRKVLLFCHMGYILTALYWTFAPATGHWLFLGCSFFVQGALYDIENNSCMHYFLQTVEQKHQVTASIAMTVLAGALGGLLASLASGFLLEFFGRQLEDRPGILYFRCYFLATAILLAPGLLAFLRLQPLPEEKREPPFHWHFPWRKHS
ncbi:MAG: MFS transporter [Victivallales bacterium]|nr:MFS transporter [Victivallales bacterium]